MPDRQRCCTRCGFGTGCSGSNRGMTPTDDRIATRARERFAAQVRLGFIAMLSLCVAMLLIHG